ncbi:2-oxoglutarate and iron-dependent oxygenase domain-containing protein 2-like [Ostrea edulis]|uniref:2-oxoglutarate and iron-dependent oxygenase domain-containing protein 2-like n=1 Tax=Ostrea edulis TaxID=37623 RepID=UPI0024AEA476|nr:2-oxoglutarate and iron-dependent oxygenase domain-containing protein 2-like [Ostrea edulis]
MTYFVCRCFFTNNIFLKKYNLHVSYHDIQQLERDYLQVLRKRGCDTEEKLQEVRDEIEREVDRRKRLGDDSLKRKEIISTKYRPLHPDIYCLKDEYLSPEFLDLVRYCKSNDTADYNEVFGRINVCKADRVYTFPFFTSEFCHLFVDEMEHFEANDCPKGRPNTMNKYGVLLNEIGFDENFLTPLRENYLTPLTSVLFPDWGGGNLDSHKAFVVKYKLGEDTDLNYHYDNAEVTLNVSMGKDFTGGELYFGDMFDPRSASKQNARFTENSHVPTIALLHRGRHRHGAWPITSGERYNLIIWMRSSEVRNACCPMCYNEPDLISTKGFGDGFTKKGNIVEVCTV